MMGQLQPLIGIPFRPGGTAVDGCDCWGLVCLAYRTLYGIALDIAPASGAEVLAEAARWSRVTTPTVGDVLLFRARGWPAHVGVALGQGRMLHVVEGGVSAVERCDGPVWAARLVGAYRHPLRLGAPA